MLCFLSLFTAVGQKPNDSVPSIPTLQNLDIKQFTSAILSHDTLVLVYFSADWCIVCKRQKPILLELLRKHRQDLRIVELDMEQNPLIAEHFEVDGLPVSLLYKNGQMVWNQMGLQSLTDLENALFKYKIVKSQKNE